MRHFANLRADDRQRLFLRDPEDVALDDPILVGAALGGTLYCPATRPSLARDIARRAAEGVVSMVVCLEDAVPDALLDEAERNAVTQLRLLAERGDAVPMIFVRVRSAEQVRPLVEGLGDAAALLTGFVVPKFVEDTGSDFLDEIAAAGERAGRRFLVMPVLEAPELLHAETRLDALLGVRRLLDKYREMVPAVRVGATDLSSVYGLRRPRDLTVWHVRVIADAITDFVNVLGRADGGFTLTGPVWEYYSATERLFKPMLRETPFRRHDERRLRAELIAKDLDGFIHELTLDRANGLFGKTVIHPSHVAPVHALSVVAHEEYADARSVLDTARGGGAAASSYGNKMNESKPHTAWAERTMLRARAFGVAHEGVSFVDLLAACVHP
ncbi:MAG: HpcH/HpaI aldolase/citrate lyase family protein [Jatrophihabitans sp.]|uniref:HpcH/HpaI aldolase/citrate lyase family protein n=1 Tax=Jatrophihabitans sp. TaxID=1932789 RepID=UPI003F7CDB6F